MLLIEERVINSMSFFTIIAIILIGWFICIIVGAMINAKFQLETADPILLKSMTDTTNGLLYSILGVLLINFLGHITLIKWIISIYYIFVAGFGGINLLIVFFSGLISDISSKSFNKLYFCISFFKFLALIIDFAILYFALNKCFGFTL